MHRNCDICGGKFAPRSVRRAYEYDPTTKELLGEAKLYFKKCSTCEYQVFTKEVKPYGLDTEWIEAVEITEVEYLQGEPDNKALEIVGSTASEYSKRVSKRLEINETQRIVFRRA